MMLSRSIGGFLAAAAALALVLAAPAAHAQAGPRPPEPAAAPAPPAPPARVRDTRHEGVTELQFRGVAARVLIEPEARNDIAVHLVNSGSLADPHLRTRGRRLVIDGGLHRRVETCRQSPDGFFIEIKDRGWVREADLPFLHIRVPENVVATASGGMRLTVLPSRSVQLEMQSCGVADIQLVRETADIALSHGDPTLWLTEARSAAIRIAGDSFTRIGAVREGLTLSIAGDGRLHADRIDGPVNIALQGDGEVMVRDGRAVGMSVMVLGDGSVTYRGAADQLDAMVLGDGEVSVRQVDGAVNRRVLGDGEVRVGR